MYIGSKRSNVNNQSMIKTSNFPGSSAWHWATVSWLPSVPPGQGSGQSSSPEGSYLSLQASELFNYDGGYIPSQGKEKLGTKRSVSLPQDESGGARHQYGRGNEMSGHSLQDYSQQMQQQQQQKRQQTGRKRNLGFVPRLVYIPGSGQQNPPHLGGASTPPRYSWQDSSGSDPHSPSRTPPSGNVQDRNPWIYTIPMEDRYPPIPPPRSAIVPQPRTPSPLYLTALRSRRIPVRVVLGIIATVMIGAAVGLIVHLTTKGTDTWTASWIATVSFDEMWTDDLHNRSSQVYKNKTTKYKHAITEMFGSKVKNVEILSLRKGSILAKFHILLSDSKDFTEVKSTLEEAVSSGRLSGIPTSPGVPILYHDVTGTRCVSACEADGDYQSCTSCNQYVSCGGGVLYIRECSADTLVWDDDLKRCETTSNTCNLA